MTRRPAKRSAAHFLALALLSALASGCASPLPEGALGPCPPRRADAPPAAATHGGDAERGRALFAEHCQRCHAPELAARDSRLFRDYPRLDCRDYLGSVSDAYLVKVIAEGGPAVGLRDVMKPFAPLLAPQQIADLVAFLRAGASAPGGGSP